jgi:vacuolar protein sorting-associated protein 13A/C
VVFLVKLVSSLGAVLGYSSLANIPRAPLDLFRGTVGLGLTVADNVSSGLGTVLSNLTFDADYITRREQVNSH